jgi:hypothetical protein
VETTRPLVELVALACAQCGRGASVDVAEAEGWACLVDDEGELSALCLDCADGDADS